MASPMPNYYSDRTLKNGLDAAERASLDELRGLQRKRLSWTLRHAYQNVADFKKRCDAKGVHPDDFRELSDLAKFPFTVKSDLRDNYPFGLFAVPRERVVADARVVRHHRQADRGRLYRRTTSTCGPNSWRARSARRRAGPA